jgi:SPP1 gp7 family putative phage head morphogenesis protein
MKHVSAESYRHAFGAYLRTGAPIRLAREQAGPATHYVWRTRGDERVRLSHARNEGRLFAWDEPPATGHPGEDFGCRCWAEPYVVQPEQSDQTAAAPVA